MKNIIIISLIFISTFMYGQNDIDAFRFSQFYFEGTSRSMAMANSFGAIGADVSTANTNPAGIGLFKHSELVISPSVMMSNTTSDFNGSKALGDNLSMMMSNISYVASLNNLSGDIKAVNFSFGYNRYNNFKHNYNINGVNDKGSMLDYFMLSANGTAPDNLNSYTSFRAWDTWLINQVDTTSLNYTNPLWGATPAGQTPKYGETQTRMQQVKGGAGEYYGNIALNYKDIVFFGATLGIQSFKYSYNLKHTENNFQDSIELNSFDYNEYLSDEGSGVDFKAGIIIVPTKFFRIGADFHSPSYMTITDRFSTEVNSYWDTPDDNGNFNYNSSSDQNSWTYHVTTPLRASANAAFIISKYALIGLDYEYVDYSAMKMSADDYLFGDENSDILNDFVPTYNLRGGVELNFGVLKLRGGYATFGNPYKTGNFEKTQITGGIGIATNDLYLDFAYVRNTTKTDYYLYNGYTDEPVPQMTTTAGIINMTFGLKF